MEKIKERYKVIVFMDNGSYIQDFDGTKKEIEENILKIKKDIPAKIRSVEYLKTAIIVIINLKNLGVNVVNLFNFNRKSIKD